MNKMKLAICFSFFFIMAKNFPAFAATGKVKQIKGNPSITLKFELEV